jgi:hypothetical protein
MENIIELIKNSFTGTFTLIFITTNWKAIFILFLSKREYFIQRDI